MDQRVQFIVDYQRGLQSVTELADRFEISRKTAYKWIDRHEEDGATGLADQPPPAIVSPRDAPGRRGHRAQGTPAPPALGRREAASYPHAERPAPGVARAMHPL